MPRRGVGPILVDASALLAYCKTNYDELVFETLQMTTTNVCNDEIKRQSSATDDFYQESACNRYLDLLRQNKNPDVCWVSNYKPNVNDQGEDTLISVFEAHADEVKYILLFDFDAIERFENIKHGLGGSASNIHISLPNHAFEILREDGIMTDNEYCKATYQMGIEERWMQDHALELDEVSSIDCPQFP